MCDLTSRFYILRNDEEYFSNLFKIFNNISLPLYACLASLHRKERNFRFLLKTFSSSTPEIVVHLSFTFRKLVKIEFITHLKYSLRFSSYRNIFFNLFYPYLICFHFYFLSLLRCPNRRRI